MAKPPSQPPSFDALLSTLQPRAYVHLRRLRHRAGVVSVPRDVRVYARRRDDAIVAIVFAPAVRQSPNAIFKVETEIP